MPEPPDGWDDGLDPAHRTTIVSFNRGELSPRDLMALLRDDLGLQLALAAADTRPHLLDWFGRQDIVRSGGWEAVPSALRPDRGAVGRHRVDVDRRRPGSSRRPRRTQPGLQRHGTQRA